MRKVILVASALGLALGTTLAEAQPQGGGGWAQPQQGGPPQGGRQQGGRPQGGPPQGGPQQGGRPQGGPQQGGRPHGGPQQGARPQGRPEGRPPGGPQQGRPPQGGWAGSRPGAPVSPSRPPHRPPQQTWRYSSPNPWRAPRANQWYWRGNWVNRMRAPPFHYPHGFSYRRWHAGLILPAAFLTAAFFFDNWGGAGLPPPPVGWRWVRYGPDLLLVDLATGRIHDVAYGVFY